MEHVFATHITGKYLDAAKDEKGTYCPVDGCDIRVDKSRWLYNKHIGDKDVHGVHQLLDGGIEPWKYGRVSEDKVEDITNWLSERDLIVLVDDGCTSVETQLE